MDDILPETYKVFNFGKWWNESGGFFMLFGALFIVIAAVFFWAAAIRKRKDNYSTHRQRHRDDRRHSSSSNKAETVPVENPERSHKIRRRKRRSSHPRYPKNPTLAETGGLPPVRTDLGPKLPEWPKD